MRSINEAWDATLKMSGGTFNPMTLDDVTADAWAVGIRGFEWEQDPRSDLQQFRLVYLALLNASSPACFAPKYQMAIGTWIDDGKVYVDLVALVPDRAEAIRVGQDNDQIAIYHIETGETERLRD
jgi:hypothetical protein